MNKLILGMLLRAVRGTVATALAGWIAALQQNPKWIWLVPALLALGKGLRDRWPGKFEWLPV